jgi:hypothetical protein
LAKSPDSSRAADFAQLANQLPPRSRIYRNATAGAMVARGLDILKL